MFKRVERKRKRREEVEELCLDQDTRETLGLDDTDSDGSDSGTEHESARSGDLDADIGEDKDQEEEEDAASEDGNVNDDPPISVAEALKDPIYLISLDPSVHGCVLCKGKLIKNAGMATAHKNATAHKRRFEHFRLLSVDAHPGSNAWELVRAIHSPSGVQKVELQKPSKRASKRQVKQAAIREKRKRHKELRARAITKKALKKLSTVDETKPVVPSKVNLRSSIVSQNQPGKPRKKQKLESKMSASTIMETPEPAPSDNKKSVLKSRLKGTQRIKKPS